MIQKFYSKISYINMDNLKYYLNLYLIKFNNKLINMDWGL